VQAVLPAQIQVRRLAVDPDPDGDRGGLDLGQIGEFGVGEDADDVAAVDVRPVALLASCLRGEQELGRTGGTAGQAPLVVGVQQRQRSDPGRLAGAVGVHRALAGDRDEALSDHRNRVRRQPGQVNDLDAQ
jgi:hypothetical protein